MGAGRRGVGLRCEARQLHGLPLAVYFDGAVAGDSVAIRNRFPIPENTHAGEIPGYHCWVDFYADHHWVPIDISEAWLDKAKKDYYFGSRGDNRVQLSVGRDIRLSPAQAGEPVNYFVYPYVEVEGKAFPNVRNEFSFADVMGPEKTKIAKK